MKNKKGFTLIELLAIIVILAIIAVITVPIILNIIENSKKGAATDSAYGFKDAVNKAYVTKLSGDSDYSIADDTYTVEELKTQIGLSLSGKEPGSNSWVTIEKNNVSEGCLQYDEFKVEFTDGKVSNTEKGECAFVSLIHYTDSDNSGTINLGDYVTIGEDEFYVIAEPSNGKVKLLARYNLNSSYRQESSNNYVTTEYSSTNYWWDNTNSVVKNDYTKDTYDLSYIYRNKDNNETDNNLKEYINNYKDYLESLGTNIEDARLMSYEEARGTGCSGLEGSCPTWAANQAYWLGSVSNHCDVRFVAYNGGVHGDTYILSLGVRPVVIISESSMLAS